MKQMHVRRIAQNVICPPVHVRPTAPSRHVSSSKLCDIEDWQDSEFCALAGTIMNLDQSSAVEHRKLWEFTQVVRSLSQHGMLNPEMKGLSVAAGCERILLDRKSVV